MNKLVLKEKKELPKLSWCAQIKKGDKSLKVYHGPWIETNEKCFFEGAWSGDFIENGFISATTFTGTGGSVTDKGFFFASPTNTLMPIYYYKENTYFIISNSLSFLLEVSGENLDMQYLDYDFDMISIMDGLKKCKKKIPISNKHYINICYFINLFIDKNLKIKILKKRCLPKFDNFTEYFNTIIEESRLLVNNAAHQLRKIIYNPIATISTGYDSPACSVIAKMVGCKEAITYTKARAVFKNRTDSGKKIGEIIGLKVAEFDSNEHLNFGEYREAEFISRGTGGDDLYLINAEKKLEKRIFITGHGARLWEVEKVNINPNMVRRDSSGCSMDEFRYRVGFIHFPIPFIGFTSHRSIHKISNSNEMIPWSLKDSTYNRPIPRRIVEEAGVARNIFGQEKKAVAKPYNMTTSNIYPPLENILSDISYNDFSTFAADLPFYKNQIEKMKHTILYSLHRKNKWLYVKLKNIKMFKRIKHTIPMNPIIPRKYSKLRSIHCYLFHWAIFKIKQRYTLYK